MSVIPPSVHISDLPEDDLVTGLKVDSYRLRDFLNRLRQDLIRECGSRTPDIQVRKDLLLKSPDGSVFRIMVANDGTLSTTKVGAT